jgi:MFS family permease
MFYAWLPDLLYSRHGLSMERSGLIATASLQISSAIGILAGGRLADRLVRIIRPARLYVAGAGVVLSPAFYYLVFTAPSVAGVQLCSVAFGLTAGLMMGNVFAAGYDALPECAYGIGAGVVNMCGALGGGLCVLLAGVARGSDGIQKLSAVTAALTAGAGLIMLLVVASQYGRKR